jgi:hypothetical protein
MARHGYRNGDPEAGTVGDVACEGGFVYTWEVAGQR